MASTFSIRDRLEQILLLLAFVSCSWASVAFATASPSSHGPTPPATQIETLKGIIGVHLVVSVSEDMARAGIQEGRLRGELAGRLGKAGIRILTEDEWRLSLEGAYLLLDVQGVRSSSLQGRHVISVNLSLEQVVFLPRTPPLKAMATTWRSKAALGHAADGEVEAVYSVAAGLAEIFIEDYFRANPKPGGK